MPPFIFPKDARVTTTGIFSSILNPKIWICDHGGTYVPWNSQITHILVGSSSPTWKLQQASRNTCIQLIKESELLKVIPNTLWVDAYKPISIQQIIGHSQQAKDLLSWLRQFQPLKSKAAALLTGPPGIGKTTTAHLVCKEAGYEVVEFNASDTRSATAIRDILEKAGKSTALGANIQTHRVIILDEVDGMSSSDRGGIAEITRFLRGGCAFPILCIANERTSPKLRSLASVCLDIRFSRPTKSTIAKTLISTVVKKEGLKVTQSDLETLCEQSGNDIRSIINSLQFASIDRAKGKDEILRTDIFSATGKLFGQCGRSMDEKMGWVFLDHSLIPLMVGEGYIQAADKSKKDAATALDRCWKAADSLTNWDLLDTRIRRSQAWGLLPAATVAVVQAAESVAGPAPFQIFPSWLGKQSKRLKHRRMIRDLAQRSQIHDPMLLDAQSVLRTYLFDPQLTPTQIINRLQELQMTRDDMLETLVETCFKGSEFEVTIDSKKKSALTREWNKTVPKQTAFIKQSTDEIEDDISDVEDDKEIDEWN